MNEFLDKVMECNSMVYLLDASNFMVYGRRNYSEITWEYN